MEEFGLLKSAGIPADEFDGLRIPDTVAGITLCTESKQILLTEQDFEKSMHDVASTMFDRLRGIR